MFEKVQSCMDVLAKKIDDLKPIHLMEIAAGAIGLVGIAVIALGSGSDILAEEILANDGMPEVIDIPEEDVEVSDSTESE